MFEQVKNILSEYTEEEIRVESALSADLGLSSLDLFSMVADFEENWHIEISDRDISQFIYVSDILDYLRRRVQEE